MVAVTWPSPFVSVYTPQVLLDSEYALKDARTFSHKVMTLSGWWLSPGRVFGLPRAAATSQYMIILLACRTMQGRER